jgi:5-methylcytosine-specific restriction protein A
MRWRVMRDKRPSATRRGYGERWRRFRLWYLKLHPVCAHCGRAANEVDHIQPLRDGGEKYDLENLQPLCKSCHSRKTQAEMHGKPPRLGCDVNGFPVLPG